MYTPIIASLGFILSKEKSHTLLIHRTGRDDDYHQDKFNGLGGKMEPDESVLDCLHREIKEESGLICHNTLLRGTINWPEFGPGGENWLGFIFIINSYSGTPFSHNPEGSLAWHPIAELATLPMWPGDRYFLPLVFDNEPRPFHGYMPYKNGQPLDWQLKR